ncbi:phage minor head protein [Acinetobacter pittii]|nr:phage minor head protein [Acinetobacter pittii]MDQ9813927.1 phage minor head protein [Acinetobacter pittii]
MLRATITQALEEGWSNDKLADEIGNSHAFSEDRAEMIARTETAIADVQGNMIAYKAAGVESKEWMAAPDCCDACQELDGKIIPINESFVAGSYFKDAPLHPHCRCDTLPVVT